MGDACIGSRCVGALLACLARISVSVMVPLAWLHRLCVNRQLFRCSGDPPRALGRSSSTSARIGCGLQPAQFGLVQFL